MDRKLVISNMKAQLLRDVSSLCYHNDRLWSKPIVDMVRDLRMANTQAVFFGGTLRSLLVSRLKTGKFGRPRDIDIVISGISLDQLRERFQDYVTRETRFGGLQMKRFDWQFDIWPLEYTMAFRKNQIETPQFDALPTTTFFNLEAIAVDVWTPHGKSRNIYSGNDQFFNGLIDRVLELNYEDNPFPVLCVVRTLVLASDIHFAIGPRLAKYLANVSLTISDTDLQSVQLKHYGRTRYNVSTLREWLQYIANRMQQGCQDPISLPLLTQMPLWPENEPPKLKFNLFVDSGQSL